MVDPGPAAHVADPDLAPHGPQVADPFAQPHPAELSALAAPAPAVSAPVLPGPPASPWLDPPTEPIPMRAPLGRGPRPDRPALGWTELAIGAVTYVVLQLVLGGIAVLSFPGPTPPSWALVAASAVSALGAVAVALSIRVRSLAAVGLRRVSWRLVALGAGLGAAVWLLSRVLIIVYVLITGDVSDPQEDLTVFTGPVSTVAVVVLAGLVVPLGEELLFRGLGFGVLRRYGIVLATAASGGIFALAHGLNVVFAAALVLGVLNALLYERTRAIWPSVAAHATFNLISFALVLAVGP